MPNLGDMVVRIVGDNVEFDQSIDKSQDKLDRFEQKALKVGKNLTKFVTLPILGAAGAAVKFAVDAEETADKFAIAFRGIEKKAEATAKNLADNYGLAYSESQRLLSSTGDLLKGFGANANQALDLSDRVQRLAVDLASYNNIQGGAARASEIITKAMLGERDALVSLGTKISEADIETRRLETGTKDLTGQAKLLNDSMITLDLIVEQSGDAIGNFDLTSGSTANQMRIMKARIVDVGVSFGNLMLPAVNKIVTGINDLLLVINDLNPTAKRFLLISGGIAAALGPGIIVVGQLVKGFRTTVTAIKAVIVWVKALDIATKTTIIGLVIGAVAALAGTIALLARRTREAREEQEDLTEAYEDYAGVEKSERRIALEKLRAYEDAVYWHKALSDELEFAIELYGKDLSKVQEEDLKARKLEIQALKEEIDAFEQQHVVIQEGSKLRAEIWAESEKALIAELALIDSRAELAQSTGEDINVVEEKRLALLREIDNQLEQGQKVENLRIFIAEHQELLDDYEEELRLLEEKEEALKRLDDATSESYANTKARIEDESNRRVNLLRQRLNGVITTREAEAEAHAKKMAELEEERQRQMSIVNYAISGTKEFASAAGGLLDAYYEKKKSQYEEDTDEYKKIVYKQAKAARDLALFQVAIDTASAIIGFLARPGGWAGLALSALALITGGIQAAAIKRQPLPQMAEGGIVMPRPGGVPLITAEAHQPEVIFPLDELNRFVSMIPDYSESITEPQTIHLQVTMDSRPILDKIFPATRNGSVLIDARAVT